MASLICMPRHVHRLGIQAVIGSLVMLLAGAAGPVRAEPVQVVVLYVPYPASEEFARAVSDLLSKTGYRCEAVRCPDDAGGEEEPVPASATQTAPAQEGATELAARLDELHPKLVVAVGSTAALAALRAAPDLPVVFCLVPNVLDRTFMADPAKYRSRMAGLTTDVAPDVQVEWIRKLSPGIARLGVLHSARSRLTAEAISKAGQKVKLRVSAISAHRDRIPEAMDELEKAGCDGLLMLADSDVYNSAAVQRLLLWGIRGKKPVWAFSANVVKAGAFAGLYADGAELARQTASMVEGVLGGKSITSLGLRYPEKVSSAVNERTAELIGIELDRKVREGVTTRYGSQP